MVERVQEWLCFHALPLDIDGDFGPVTSAAVRSFQRREGMVSAMEFSALTAPLIAALDTSSIDGATPFANAALHIAQQHLAQHPIELGGDNRGPWVRTYTKGHDGIDWLWCAGFVSFILTSAKAQETKAPFKYTVSCDILASEAMSKGIFVPERSLSQLDDRSTQLKPGDIFLNRRKTGDWYHTGIVLEVEQDLFRTIEGNTNHEGSSNGYEVCTRWRGYRNKDFTRI